MRDTILEALAVGAFVLVTGYATLHDIYDEPRIEEPSAPEATCSTDEECAELCPAGTRELPADHPDYCDGGPQDERSQQ